MRKRASIKIFLSLLLVLVFLVNTVPMTYATASAKKYDPHQNDNSKDKNKNKDKDKDKKTGNYLVLVGQSNGTYVAYKDIAFLTNKYVMVKAKPLATALGLGYQNNAGQWYTQGCTLSLGNITNVYYRNSKTYYIYNYDAYDYDVNDYDVYDYDVYDYDVFDFYSYDWEKSYTKCTAKYKQIVYQNYNAVHYAAINNLANSQFYNTTKDTSYSSLGYSGVVVYNRYASISGLPATSNVSNWNGSTITPTPTPTSTPKPTATPTPTPTPSVANLTVKPSTTTDSVYKDIKYVEANYTMAQYNANMLLDLTEVLKAFYNNGLAYDGVYGYGNCDTAVTIQGIDQNGKSVGEIKTNGTEFLINFPKAVKLKITGAQKNIVLDFTPVKPIVITSPTKLTFDKISWIYPSDGYARQYFVISEYMSFRPEGLTSSYALSRKMLTLNNTDNVDRANSYQRITAVFKSPYIELISPSCYINVQKTDKGINNSLVVFSDTGNAVLAADYEKKLNNMITTLSSVGVNTYFPTQNFNRQLVMKLTDNNVNTAYSYITVDASTLNLDHFYDYYLHLHEMIHYYEATQLHYGFRFDAWKDGNATHLAKKTMDKLSVSYKDTSGNDYFDLMYNTDFSFLTADNKKSFETYYLNATGWNATLVGYHFTKYLQDMYGSDVVYRILDKVYAAKIPTNAGRNSTYDKQFTDCIKAVTTQNVFQNFVDYYVN